MKYDDQKYPVHYLYKGLDKLQKYGIKIFLQYCAEVDMPFCDQNRVLMKANVSYGTHYKQMECPPELKDEKYRLERKYNG